MVFGAMVERESGHGQLHLCGWSVATLPRFVAASRPTDGVPPARCVNCIVKLKAGSPLACVLQVTTTGFSKVSSRCTLQAGPELSAFLPLPLQYWDRMCAPPHSPCGLRHSRSLRHPLKENKTFDLLDPHTAAPSFIPFCMSPACCGPSRGKARLTSQCWDSSPQDGLSPAHQGKSESASPSVALLSLSLPLSHFFSLSPIPLLSRLSCSKLSLKKKSLRNLFFQKPVLRVGEPALQLKVLSLVSRPHTAEAEN